MAAILLQELGPWWLTNSGPFQVKPGHILEIPGRSQSFLGHRGWILDHPGAVEVPHDLLQWVREKSHYWSKWILGYLQILLGRSKQILVHLVTDLH